MNAEALKTRILALLTDIAPDIDPATVQPDQEFRDQFDFDSMDQLNFAIAIHKAFDIEIPESDYPKLASLSKCIVYTDSKQQS